MRGVWLPRRSRRGFTLVELMIASVVSIVVMLAVYTFFLVQSRAYTTMELSTEMDADLRFAQDMITKSLASSVGLANGDLTYAGALTSAESADNALQALGLLDRDLIGALSNEQSRDQIVAVVPDASTTFPTRLASGNRTCDSDFPDAMVLGFDAALDAVVEAIDTNAYPYVVCKDYARPRGARAFIFEVETVGDSVTTGQLDVAGGTYPDMTAECDGDELPEVMECAGANVWSFYIQHTDGAETDPAYGVSSLDGSDWVLWVNEGMTLHKTPRLGNPTNPTSTGDFPLVDGIFDLQVRQCESSDVCVRGPGVNDFGGWDVPATVIPPNTIRMAQIGLTVVSSRGVPAEGAAGSTQQLPLSNSVPMATQRDRMFRSTFFNVVLQRGASR